MCKSLFVFFKIIGRYKFVSNEEKPGEYYVALELSNPEPVDAATYRLNAKNANGESNANLKLNFDGKCVSRAILVLQKVVTWKNAEWW